MDHQHSSATFHWKYAPSGTVGKNSINCKPPKTFKVSNYILISKDPSQPCEFKLNFKVSKGKGRVAKGKAYCKSPTTTTTLVQTTTTTSPAPSEVIAKQDALLASQEVFNCLECLKEHAPQCIPPCIRGPNPLCTECVFLSAPECLGPCG